MFLPVVDCTWQYINAILILASNPTANGRCSSTIFAHSFLRESWKSWRGWAAVWG